MKKKFYIGTYKNGQDFAKIVDDFGHEKKERLLMNWLKCSIKQISIQKMAGLICQKMKSGNISTFQKIPTTGVFSSYQKIKKPENWILQLQIFGGHEILNQIKFKN